MHYFQDTKLPPTLVLPAFVLTSTDIPGYDSCVCKCSAGILVPYVIHRYHGMRAIAKTRSVETHGEAHNCDQLFSQRGEDFVAVTAVRSEHSLSFVRSAETTGLSQVHHVLET